MKTNLEMWILFVVQFDTCNNKWHNSSRVCGGKDRIAKFFSMLVKMELFKRYGRGWKTDQVIVKTDLIFNKELRPSGKHLSI